MKERSTQEGGAVDQKYELSPATIRHWLLAGHHRYGIECMIAPIQLAAVLEDTAMSVARGVVQQRTSVVCHCSVYTFSYITLCWIEHNHEMSTRHQDGSDPQVSGRSLASDRHTQPQPCT